jgi:hypothetical protein
MRKVSFTVAVGEGVVPTALLRSEVIDAQPDEAIGIGVRLAGRPEPAADRVVVFPDRVQRRA